MSPFPKRIHIILRALKTTKAITLRHSDGHLQNDAVVARCTHSLESKLPLSMTPVSATIFLLFCVWFGGFGVLGQLVWALTAKQF